MRVEHVRFYTEVLRDRRQTVGRLDGRFTGWDPDYGREHWENDPSFTALTGAYTAALNHYVRAELEYPNDLPYEVLSSSTHEAWSFKEFENAHVTVADKLAAAMRANPHLRVHVASGYLDGATPYYATDHVLAHLQLPAELRENIEVAYYEAGHMMYAHEPSRLRQSKDIAAFVRSSANR
jgi:carboxypeptidase C (cathepsin A)